MNGLIQAQAPWPGTMIGFPPGQYTCPDTMIGLMPGQATENRQYQGPTVLPGQLGPGTAYSHSTQGPGHPGLVLGISTTRTGPGTLVPGRPGNQANICCPGLASQHHQAQACPGALALLAWALAWLAWALGCPVPPRPRPGPARALLGLGWQLSTGGRRSLGGGASGRANILEDSLEIRASTHGLLA